MNLAIHRLWEIARENAAAVGFAVLLVLRIVDEKSIGGGRTSNDDATHGMSLVPGAFLIPILLVMNPCVFILAKPMDQ